MRLSVTAVSIALLVVCAASSSAVHAQQMKRTTSDRLVVIGRIEPTCSVDFNTDHPMARPFEALRYNSTAPQVVAQVTVLCNFQQETVNVTYESLNRGLRNEFGAVIDYEKSLSGVRGGGMASEGPWTIAQRTGGRPYFFRVSPRNMGLISGHYSDVIVVSVASH